MVKVWVLEDQEYKDNGVEILNDSKEVLSKSI